MRKYKIYVLLANNRTLAATGGDKINEIRFYKALSIHFDVYYNGQLFKPNDEDFGIVDKPIIIPEDIYDLYYVRANNYILANCPRPKVAMAYPYSHWLYHHVDALIVTTSMWGNFIEQYNHNEEIKSLLLHWYKTPVIVEPKKIANIRQTIDPYFEQVFSEDEINAYKVQFGWSNIFGFFGSLAMQLIPWMALEALKKLKNEIPSISIIAAGKKYSDTKLPNFVKTMNPIDYEKMPIVLRACSCLLANEGAETEYLGSGKVLDAMACGVPIIAFKSAVRIEQLGDDYAGFYTAEEEVYDLIKMFITDKSFQQLLKTQVLNRRELFNVKSQAEWIKEQLIPLVDESKNNLL